MFYIRLENTTPYGSPQFLTDEQLGQVGGTWVEYVFCGDAIDTLIQGYQDIYDADQERVVQTIYDLENPRDLIVENVRVTRNELLAASDYTQMPDVTFNAGVKESWATYRQSLRNLPANIPSDIASLGDVVWPTPPPG